MSVVFLWEGFSLICSWPTLYLQLPPHIFTILHYTVRPNKKETRFISEISSLPRKIETNYASLSRAFSLLSFDTKHIMISQCMNEREQFKLMHVKNDLRRIMVLSTMTKFKLANPCQNKESKQKKHDKRDKRNTNECLSTRPFVLNRGRPR